MEEKKHITKAEINELPMRQYRGHIHLIRKPADVGPAVEVLSKERILGFDTETRPAFRKGERYDPSLIQLAARDSVYLFQITLTGLDDGLLTLLADPETLKAGVSIDRDISELRALRAFEPGGFVELATHAKAAGLKNLGLRGMAGLLLGFRISKREQRSNWSRQALSPGQLRYAATDAWLGRELYRHLETHHLLAAPSPSS